MTQSRTYSRYAIYDLPEDSQLAEAGACWLGWDAIHGKFVQQPEFSDIEAATTTPGKYGFHATLKPPFRLADGCSVDSLSEAVAKLAAQQSAAECNGLQVSNLGKFLALTPLSLIHI